MIGKSIGKYRIVAELGVGQLGPVYRAVDESVGREVAIKVLRAELRDSDALKRFMSDASVLGKLNRHEHAAVYKVSKSEQGLIVVMELVKGESLEHLAKLPGPLPAERAAYLTSQVLEALSRAHNAGVIHGDLRPSNLMLTDTRFVKIMGFGFARFLEAERAADKTIKGVQDYLAPEQLMFKDIDTRTDLYACGVVLYKLLTGMLPFQANSPDELRHKVLHDAPTPVTAYLPDLPEWCGRVCTKALAKAPADRFQTAEEFLGALKPAPNSSSEIRTGSFSAIPVAVIPPKAAAAPLPASAPAPLAAADRLPRTKLMTGAIVLVAIVATVAAYNFGAALMRPAAPDAGVAPPAASGASENPVATPAPETPAPPAPAAAAAPPGDKVAAAPAAKAAPTPSTAPGTVPSTSTPAAAATAAPAAAAASVRATAAVVFPELAFDVEAVVADGDKFREREARIVLANGMISVSQRNDQAIAGFPLNTVESISYSTARHPLWMSPNGPAELLKVEGGVFGIRQSGRNWIALQTKEAIQVIRVKDEDIRRVIAALEERAGRAVVRVAERKD